MFWLGRMAFLVHKDEKRNRKTSSQAEAEVNSEMEEKDINPSV